MSTPCEIQVSLLDIDDRTELGVLWTDLQSRSDHSFFTSWGWIGCWLDRLPRHLRPQILRAENDSGVVGLAILHRLRQRRGTVIASRVLFLNETGDETFDKITVEHNSLLADRSVATEVHRACLNYLVDSCHDWDEFSAPGVDVDSAFDRALADPPAGIRSRVDKQCPCYLVDLGSLRESGQSYLSTLSSHAQKQIRKSVRLYEVAGPLRVECAATLAEALQFYEGLKALHQSLWAARGESGAFGSEFTDGFHRSLIESCFPRGEIQLLHIRAGETTIGYIYSFVHEGRVLVYQTGFVYEDNNSKKPGMVSHALAIQHNLDHGAAIYDFLGGDARYKQSLGQEGPQIRWTTWQRPRLRFQVEDWLRATKHRLAGVNRLA